MDKRYGSANLLEETRAIPPCPFELLSALLEMGPTCTSQQTHDEAKSIFKAVFITSSTAVEVIDTSPGSRIHQVALDSAYHAGLSLHMLVLEKEAENCLEFFIMKFVPCVHYGSEISRGDLNNAIQKLDKIYSQKKQPRSGNALYEQARDPYIKRPTIIIVGSPGRVCNQKLHGGRRYSS
ncbi:hypothetical protein K469DRAFT_687094 [Zopfia rhizophila CBS 207.26]|uniref:Uncharacterized protein n=1 Tax=Zopfia rhizophila CBS 207.26 TaxID=1314779 RepID=A0A6A6E4C9_9PEZI|nr:hypothetical protein K469DRAFT_687094 [Zopfia rhizophila CBS 207.26]